MHKYCKTNFRRKAEVWEYIVLAISLVIVGIFWLSGALEAHAATLKSQLTYDKYTTKGYAGIFLQPLGFFNDTLGQYIISRVALRGEAVSTSTHVQIIICDNGDYNVYGIGCTNELDYLSSETIPNSGGDALSVYNFTNINAKNKYAYIRIGFADGLYDTVRVYGTNSTAQTCSIAQTGTLYDCANFTEFFYIVSGPVYPFIQITYPSDGTTLSTDFDYWNIFVNGNTSTTTNFEINYGVDNVTDFTDSYPGNLSASYYSSVFNSPKNHNLQPETIYQAQARLYDASGTIATSSIIQFEVGSSSVSNTFYYFNSGYSYMDASGTVQTASCPNTTSTFLGFDYAQSFCKAIAFLFVPNQNALDKFHEIPTNFLTRIPFVYVSGVISAVTSYSTTTQSFPTIQLAGIKMNGSTSSKVTVFSSSTVDTYYTSTYRIFFRSLVLFGFYAMIAMQLWGEAQKLLN